MKHTFNTDVIVMGKITTKRVNAEQFSTPLVESIDEEILAFKALKALLIEKGILSEEEIQDVVSSIKIANKLSES